MLRFALLDSGRNEEPEFWNLLGGKAGVKGANEVPSDDEVKEAVSQLFTGDGQLVAQGALDRSALQSDGTFLVDSGTEVFVWIGKGAPADVRRNAMANASTFLANNGRPDWTPITRVPEGGEQPAFKALFKVCLAATPRFFVSMSDLAIVLWWVTERPGTRPVSWI